MADGLWFFAVIFFIPYNSHIHNFLFFFFLSFFYSADTILTSEEDIRWNSGITSAEGG